MPKKYHTTPRAQRRIRPELARLPVTGLRPYLCLDSGAAPLPHSSDRPLVARRTAAAFEPSEVLLGRSRLSGVSGQLSVWLLHLSDDHAELISRLDYHSPPPSALAATCLALWSAGLRLPAISEVLGLGVGASVVQRYIRAAAMPEALLSLLDRGLLSWGHLRVLDRLKLQDQLSWGERAVARRWSVRALAAALSARTAAAPSADHAHFEGLLREALQTDALRLVSSGDGSYALELTWSWLPALQSVFERLGQAPFREDADTLPRRPRTLRIELDSADELDALAGHLLPEL